MDCPREQILSTYADGELALAEARSLESHLIQCRRCRRVILALQDEGAVLRDVLHGREFAPVPVLAPSERARGLVIGVVPAVAIVALVVTVGSWLLGFGMPAGTGWLSPIRFMGVYEMTFDVIFMVRDRAPALLELAIAVGALLGVASILTFLVGSLARRVIGPSAVLFALLGGAAGAPPEASAFELRRGEKDVVIAAGETVSNTLIIEAKTIRIAGRIEGSLVAMADSIRIEGEIDGNLAAFAEEVDISGDVDGALYLAAEVVRVDGRVHGDVYSFSRDLRFGEAGVLERDVTLFAERVQVDGRVGRDLVLFGERLELRGQVGRDLIARSEAATLADGARVERDLVTWLRDGVEASIAPGAVIGGERREQVIAHDFGEEGSRFAHAGFYMRKLALITSAFLVGMLLHVLRPGLFEGALPTAADFFRELGLGFVTLIVAPIAIVLSFVTVIGIPLGLIATFVFVTGLFVSMIVVAALLGTAVLGGHGGSALRFGRALLFGLLVIAVVVEVPFVGGLLWVIALVTGTGMLVGHVRDTYRYRTA